MQTFLPVPSFSTSASLLDDQRLFNQPYEVLDILSALQTMQSPMSIAVTTGTKSAKYRFHPAVLMWVGFEKALVSYGHAITHECYHRCKSSAFFDLLKYFPGAVAFDQFPPFIGDNTFHISHRAALLKKDFAFYGRYGWNVAPQIKYFWPVRIRDKTIIYPSEHYAKAYKHLFYLLGYPYTISFV